MAANRQLLLTRLSDRLHALFDNSINLSDVADKPAKERENFFLTRALSALALMDDAGLLPDQAAKCVTDGSADDGIDALHIDDKRKVIYFVQSKWRSGAKGVELVDFTRFRDGVKGVLELKWTAENKNLHPFRTKVESTLKDIETTFVMLIAHTADKNIAKNINSKISDFVSEQNKIQSDFLEFKEIDFASVTHIARSKVRASDIDVSVMLRNWGRLQKPYDAIYGAVSAVDVAKWYEDNGTKLFAENLRYVIEKSEVNEGIAETADKEPAHFWYFNNGVTAICDSFAKQPIGGTKTDTGIFDVKKISVINGAQTIGSLAKAKNGQTSLDDVLVHVRIISLQNTPEGFASGVTRSNNTQNDLNASDFVAFDPNQDRLKREAAQLGITYAFRRGEADPASASGFNIRAATVAAACASGDLRLAVASKRYISGLWDDIKKEPYIKLFNDSTTAVYLWNIVQLMNTVDDTLAKQADGLEGRERLIAVHGNRFILFCVFSHIDLTQLAKPATNLSSLRTTCEQLAVQYLEAVIPAIAGNFPDSYPGNIFKNQDRQEELLGAIES
ncbi:AIPR family protein [Bradyrhizobium retamae]|uniref:AIPR family protein n=1 Tax=Bradyrhizobium retamae TaxID=1300035 RepID=UPI000A49A15F|nr:AIPR family protein [Bradyrhizobium retamae]